MAYRLLSQHTIPEPLFNSYSTLPQLSENYHLEQILFFDYAAQILSTSHLHIPAALLLFFVVIRLVTYSDFLLFYFSAELLVDLNAARDWRRRRLLLKYFAHMVEEASC